MSMPSTLAQSREALLQVLRTVPGAGVIHDRERYAASEQAFRTLYVYTPTDPDVDAFGVKPHIRGWYMRRTATTEVTENGRVLNEHTWSIRGYMAFQDEMGSELVFDELVERMRDAVRVNPTLGLASLLGASVATERGVQVASAGPVFFAGALCHSALLELRTRNWAEWRSR